jgi:hypothetical protein
MGRAERARSISIFERDARSRCVLCMQVYCVLLTPTHRDEAAMNGALTLVSVQKLISVQTLVSTQTVISAQTLISEWLVCATRAAALDLPSLHIS